MVGVPSSKGCTTCRRRKVRCDEARPVCRRCIKAKKICEGYERFPVFIQHTGVRGRGILPRKFLEEAKPAEGAVPLNCQVLGGSGSSSTRMWDDSVMGWFLSEYAAGPDTWLRYAIDLSAPTAALRKSLLALSFTRFGRVKHNYDMVLHGQRIYSESLVLVQKALYDSDLMFHDETFASIRAMSLYELFESTSGDPGAWQKHLSGITHLIELRGPARYRSPLARAVLADVRYGLMLKALMLRKGSPFGRKEWLMDWNSAEQKFYDLGFELAALIEQTDNGVYDINAYNDLHDSLMQLDTQLTDRVLRLNWLGSLLLLNFAASSLGLEWASKSPEITELMMEMLPSMVDACSKSSHRCIFPLTGLAWHYRASEQKSREVQELRNLLSQGRQVRFMDGRYDVKSMIPIVARN